MEKAVKAANLETQTIQLRSIPTGQIKQKGKLKLTELYLQLTSILCCHGPTQILMQSEAYQQGI